MIASNVAAVNLALGSLGAKPINDLSDTTDSTAVFANTLFQTVLDNVLRQSDYGWSCATERVQLSSLSATIYTGHDYVFSLPTDYLRIICPIDFEDETYMDLWEEEYLIEGRRYYSDRETVGIKYTKQVTDVTDLDDWVADAFVAALAYRLAIRLTENPQKVQIMQGWMGAAFAEALDMDARAKKTRPAKATQWTDVG